jgi:hypothetical protein
MNIITILISSQLTHVNLTSLVVHLKCTLKVPTLFCTILLHFSILKTLLSCFENTSPSPFNQYNNSLLFQSFPKASISQRKILIYKYF